MLRKSWFPKHIMSTTLTPLQLLESVWCDNHSLPFLFAVRLFRCLPGDDYVMAHTSRPENLPPVSQWPSQLSERSVQLLRHSRNTEGYPLFPWSERLTFLWSQLSLLGTEYFWVGANTDLSGCTTNASDGKGCTVADAFWILSASVSDTCKGSAAERR